jgi:hypothetical protein
VVAQPWRRAEELVTLWLCVAPLRLGGLRGKKSTPSIWLGGTGEFVAVGKQEQELQEHKNQLLQALRTHVCKSRGISIFLRVFMNCSFNG